MLRRTDRIFSESVNIIPKNIPDIYAINFKDSYVYDVNYLVNIFKCTKELKMVYGFHCFEDALKWVKNNPEIRNSDFAIATGKELIETLDFLGLWK